MILVLLALVALLVLRRAWKADRRHRRYVALLKARGDRLSEDAYWLVWRRHDYLHALRIRRERFAPVIVQQEIEKLRARNVAPGVFMAPGFSARVPQLRAVEGGDAA